MAARNRLPLYLTGAVGAFGGYYLYSAGGNPKVAEKQVEHDAARVSTSIRDHLPGREKELKTEAKVLGEQYGQKMDDALKQAKDKTHEYDAKFEAYRADAEKNIDKYRQEAGKEIHNAVENFDKKVGDGVANVKHTVEENVNKTKSGFSSWFGGK